VYVCRDESINIVAGSVYNFMKIRLTVTVTCVQTEGQLRGMFLLQFKVVNS
jgi:hypothetical protein